MMGRNFGVDYDESDLMQELDELDGELISDQLNEGIGLPSYIPGQANSNQANAQPAQPNAANSDEAQLQNMMQI